MSVLHPLDKALEARSPALSDAQFDALQQSVRFRCLIRRTVELTLEALVFIALASVLFLRIPQVEGRSMLPTIEDGNHVLINTLAYGLRLGPLTLDARAPERGDIVAFVRGEGDDRKVFLKRVIGLPGERIAFNNGRVLINGVLLAEPYRVLVDRATMQPVVVPSSSVFVLGDNRSESDDSRTFGSVSLSTLIGKARFIIWPIGHVKEIR